MNTATGARAMAMRWSAWLSNTGISLTGRRVPSQRNRSSYFSIVTGMPIFASSSRKAASRSHSLWRRLATPAQLERYACKGRGNSQRRNHVGSIGHIGLQTAEQVGCSRQPGAFGGKFGDHTQALEQRGGQTVALQGFSRRPGKVTHPAVRAAISYQNAAALQSRSTSASTTL